MFLWKRENDRKKDNITYVADVIGVRYRPEKRTKRQGVTLPFVRCRTIAKVGCVTGVSMETIKSEKDRKKDKVTYVADVFSTV